MNGASFTLGLAGLLAGASELVRRRGSRSLPDESITDRYGHGECHAFTRALMERFPQAKIGVVALDDVYHDDEILHSLIKVDGMLLDAYGWGTTEEKLDLFAFKKTRGSRLVVRPARKEEAAAILKTKGIVDARAAVRLVLDAVGQKGSRVTLVPKPPALASPWFHGTTSSFRAFKGNPKSATPSVLGVWLASKREVAEAFARQSYDLRRLGEPRVLTVEADIENPKVYDTYEAFLRDWRDAGRGTTLKRQLMRAGHDGILVRRSTTDVGMERSDLLVFDPKQARVVGEEALAIQGSRAMVLPQALPEGLVVSITEAKNTQWRPIYKDVDWITVTISEEAGRLWRKGEVGGVLLLLRTRRNLWEIESIEASKGYGPLLYDLGMELAFLDGAKGIVPDRTGVSDRAESVWVRYEETRPDVLRAVLPQDYPDRDKHTLRHRPHLDLAYRKQGAPLLDALRRQGRLRAYGTPTSLVQRVVGSKG